MVGDVRDSGEVNQECKENLPCHSAGTVDLLLKCVFVCFLCATRHEGDKKDTEKASAKAERKRGATPSVAWRAPA